MRALPASARTDPASRCSWDTEACEGCVVALSQVCLALTGVFDKHVKVLGRTWWDFLVLASHPERLPGGQDV